MKSFYLKILVDYKTDNGNWEGRVALFDPQNHSVENIAKFSKNYDTYQVATTQNKVNSCVRYFRQFLGLQVFAINGEKKSFEIYDFNTGEISRGLLHKSVNDQFKEFTGPVPLEWRKDASTAYYKDALYSLGGANLKTNRYMSRVDVRRSIKSRCNN